MPLPRCFRCPVADTIFGCLQILQFVLVLGVCVLDLCTMVAEMQHGHFRGNGTTSDADLYPSVAFRFHEVRDYFLRELEDAYEDYPREITTPPIFRQRREKVLPVCDFDLFSDEPQEEEKEEVRVCSYLGGAPELDRNPITGVPSPFEDWDVELCGPLPIDPSVFRAGAGQGQF